MGRFVNFTNHPSSRWSEEQLLAAGGDVRDVQFPNVSPHASEEELDTLAQECVEQLLALSPDTVLVQGEMTLTFRVVSLLHQHGVRCVAATSERRVVETTSPNGETVKTTVFSFVQFRSY